MINFKAKPVVQMAELLVAEGHPDKDLLEQIKMRSSALITSLLGDKNTVWLSKPVSYDILAYAQKHQIKLPVLISSQSDKADFIVVQWACSFRPAPECEFIRASVQVHLHSPTQTHTERAVAVDMYPGDIKVPITVKRSFGVSPNMKLKFLKVLEGETSLGNIEKSSEWLSYEPQITTFALGEPTPGWDFNKTKAMPIRGSKSLFLLVKKPKGAKLWGSFSLSASLQTNIGRIPLSTFFLTGGTTNLINERYLLSE